MDHLLANLATECIFGIYSNAGVQDRCLNTCTYSDVVCSFHKSKVDDIDIGSLIKIHTEYVGSRVKKQTTKNKEAVDKNIKLKYVNKAFDILLSNRFYVLHHTEMRKLIYDRLCHIYIDGGKEYGFDIRKYINGFHYRYLIHNGIIKHNYALSDEINDIINTYDLTTEKIKINIIL